MVNPEQLMAQFEALQRENQLLKNELIIRGEAILKLLVDALDTNANMALQGHPGAKMLIHRWSEVMANAQAAEHGLKIARGLSANSQ